MAENPDTEPDITEPDPENEPGTSRFSDEDERESPLPPPKRPDDPVGMGEKLKLFFGTHLAGIVAVITPLLFLLILLPFPPQKWQWCAFTLCVMAVYWVFECIPLPVTSFIPIIIFPLTDIMDTRTVSMVFINDTVMMFLGSIMLAASVEQSGLHKRIALLAIKIIGYSHYKMLFAVAFVTMFISMWITNTAAATMMVPIVFALLKVYEDQKLYVIYETNKMGETHSTPLTSCYFCCITFAATIGGIGTLVGTATNLVFKGLFVSAYPSAPEYVSFPLYSAFAVPYMIAMNIAMYFYLIVVYMGFGRPKSAAAKSINIPEVGLLAAKRAVAADIKKLGSTTWHEIMVIILFGGAMLLFFSRSPQLFVGWADLIEEGLGMTPKSIKDSAAASFVIFLMTLLPATSGFFKNFSAKSGGFALSTAAKKEYADLNGQIGLFLDNLVGMPNTVVLMVIIIFTTFITNFASNVAICNVVAPVAMQLAVKLGVNPLWYCIAAGVAASYCFMLPVGTPGNLIVQSAAKIPTSHMMYAGAGPTVTTIILTWFFVYFFAPIIWPVLHEMPEWIDAA